MKKKEEYVARKLVHSRGRLSAKDIDENRLIAQLNEYWAESDFGYPIHQDVRIPSGVAELLRTESQQQLGTGVQDDESLEKLKEMLRLSSCIHSQPELLYDFERLLK